MIKNRLLENQIKCATLDVYSPVYSEVYRSWKMKKVKTVIEVQDNKRFCEYLSRRINTLKLSDAYKKHKEYFQRFERLLLRFDRGKRVILTHDEHFFLGNDLDSNYRFMGRYDDHINSDFYDTTKHCLQVIQKIRKRCPDCEG